MNSQAFKLDFSSHSILPTKNRLDQLKKMIEKIKEVCVLEEVPTPILLHPLPFQMVSLPAFS